MTPARATAQTGSHEEKPQQQSHPSPGGHTAGHRANPARSLDNRSPHGCSQTWTAVALGSRARPGTLANPALLWAVAGALGLQFAGLHLPFLNDLLKTEPLSALDLLVVFALSTLGYAAIRLDRVVHPDGRWPPRRRRGPGVP